MCVRVCVSARSQRVSLAPPVPEDIAVSAGSGTPAHCGELQGVRGCSRAGAPALQTSQGPDIESHGQRGQVQGFSASWAALPRAHGATRPPAPGTPGARRGRRRGARGPEGKREEHRQLACPRSLRAPTPRPPSKSNPFPGLPSPPLCAFSKPGTLRFPPRTVSEGKQGSEPRASKMPPNLPAVSQTPGSCADYMAQEQDGFKSYKAQK